MRDTQTVITVFSPYHAGYLLVIITVVTAGAWLLYRRAECGRQAALRAAAWTVPLLYAADFFIMPLSNADHTIDVGKLPFHICTLMGLLIPFAQFHHHGHRIRDAVATLSLVGALCFLIFPGSAVGHGRHPFSYSVVQTFVYHGSMLAWSVWTLLYGGVILRLRRLWRPAILLGLITLWAGFANILYSHEGAQYDWLFLTGQSVPFLPPWSLSIFVPLLLFTGVTIVYAVFQLADGKKMSKK